MAVAEAVIADSRLRLTKSIRVTKVALRRIEIGVVEDVEEIREKCELRTLRDLERFSKTQSRFA